MEFVVIDKQRVAHTTIYKKKVKQIKNFPPQSQLFF